MNEHYSELLYNQILKIVVKYIKHNHTTYNHELDKAAKHFLGYNYIGTFSSSNMPKKINKNQYCIANNKPENHDGEHWVAFSHDLVYDSFGRPYKSLSDYWSNLKHKDTDMDREQEFNESNCGQRCLAWLILYHYFGKHHAINI